VLHCAVLCCAVLCCAALHCAVLCCAVLCCAVLHCAVLCCAVLCYNTLAACVLCAVLVPLVRPDNVLVDMDSLRSTSVRLFWNKINLTPDKVRGFFRGYRVSMCALLSILHTGTQKLLYTVSLMQTHTLFLNDCSKSSVWLAASVYWSV